MLPGRCYRVLPTLQTEKARAAVLDLGREPLHNLLDLLEMECRGGTRGISRVGLLSGDWPCIRVLYGIEAPSAQLSDSPCGEVFLRPIFGTSASAVVGVRKIELSSPFAAVVSIFSSHHCSASGLLSFD